LRLTVEGLKLIEHEQFRHTPDLPSRDFVVEQKEQRKKTSPIQLQRQQKIISCEAGHSTRD
jgi:hypothetical protein